MPNFPTTKELDLWDVELPEGTALSVFPPANEHMIDPFWYDQGGRDPVDQAFILRMEYGPERTAKLQKIVEKYSRYGPKLYEKFAVLGRHDLLLELKYLGVSTDVKEATNKVGCGEDDGEEDDVEDADRVPLVDIEIPLLQASISGHLDSVKFFVEEAKDDINLKGDMDDTALTHAAARGYLHIVQWLMGNSARISFDVTDKRQNDIYLAMKSGNLEVVKALLDSEQCSEEGYKPSADLVVAAAVSGNRDVLALALEINGFPDVAPDDTSMNLEAPALTTAQENVLQDALPHAVSAASLDAAKLLLSFLCPRNEDGQFATLRVPPTRAANLFNATEDAMEKADNENLFQLIWDTVLSPSADDLAASESRIGDRQAQLNRRLISACSEGCPRTVKLLCEKYGANVNHVSHKFFSTPLGRAVGSGSNPFPGRFSCAQYLLQRPEINIHLGNAKYCNGPTALVLAAQEAVAGGPKIADKTLPMVKLMLEHGGPLEDINHGLINHLQSVSPNEDVTICVAVYNGEARLPVRLMLEDEYNRVVQEHPRTTKVILRFAAAEALTILANAQLRKRDTVLAGSDVKRRPLKSNLDENQGSRAQVEEQAAEADEATLHNVSMHATQP